MSMRKRPRASLLETSDHEADELSPRKSDIATSRMVRSRSSAKKQKLDDHGSGTGTSAGVLAGIRKTAGTIIGGLFGSPGEREADGRTSDGDETVDELAAEEEVVSSQRRRGARSRMPNGEGKARAGRKSNGDVWDVPDSDEEQEVTNTKKSAGRVSLSNGTGSATNSGSTRRRTTIGHINGSSEEGLERNEVRRSVGRSRQDSSPGIEVDIGGQNSALEPRTNGRTRKVSNRALENLTQDVVKLGEKRKNGSSPAQSPVPTSQPVKRKRGRPRKNLDEVIEAAKKGSPKGILTPSKGGGLRTKKSVAFERPTNEIDLGFKDIPSSVNGKTPRPSPKSVEKQPRSEAEEQNDQACTVCSKKHNRKGNEILLCDGCDFAVHLKCYDLKEIPEGDWFCKTCDPDAYAEAGRDEEEEDEDAACGICSKKRVRKGNEILLCDGCDFAVHLKCYGLSSIPEGDWFCKTCSKDEASLVMDKSVTESGSQERKGEDETSCAICSGLDSGVGNKIILCDGCEFAVHVKCYELPEFPRGDWYCRTCLAAAGEDPFNLAVVEELVDDETQGDGPDIEDIEDHLKRVQRAVVDKLVGQKRMKLVGYDDEVQKVHQVVEQTVLAGEGNSMLVIGARGCGKTTLVESVITNLEADHSKKFHVVRLNGFIHTDDKIASKEIWRQLGREMEVEDDKPTNYADTLASLLALLSHPSEHPDAVQGQTAKSIVFILDEFDLFTTHSRQTLLYNLFDIAQARKAPIVVLGLTTRIDVVESLEKRVKSRFSHRYVHLSLPRTVPAFWDICKEALIVDFEYSLEDATLAGTGEFLTYWNSMIESLYIKDLVFKHHLQSQFYRNKSIPALFTSLLLPITALTSKTLPLTGKKLVSYASLQPPDSKLHILPSLSQLSLALLISAARLDIIHDTDTCNFAMAYDEYCALTSKHKIQTSASGVNAVGGAAKVWGRDVAIGEWERLSDVGVLLPAGFGGGGGAARDGGKAGRMWKVDVGLEEIEGSVELSSVMTKWCREI